MKRTAVALALTLAMSAPAKARHHHHRHHHHHHHRAVHAHVERGNVVGGRPAGCPHAFCGCEASLYLYGKIIPELNLAYNWVRKFPRALPGYHMAAARWGHVFVLIRHIRDDVWWVHDGNSGGHLTREHARSIRGYTIVDPTQSRNVSDGPRHPPRKHRVAA